LAEKIGLDVKEKINKLPQITDKNVYSYVTGVWGYGQMFWLQQEKGRIRSGKLVLQWGN